MNSATASNSYWLEGVRMASQRAARDAYRELQRGVTSLAAISSAAALVGILGSLVHIITRSFPSIGTSKSAMLGYTAGSLSDSMSFTAVGLFVALVAYLIHEILASRLSTFDREMENASVSLVNALALHLRRLRIDVPMLPASAVMEPGRRFIPVARTWTALSLGDDAPAPRLYVAPAIPQGLREFFFPSSKAWFELDSALARGMCFTFAYAAIAAWRASWLAQPVQSTLICVSMAAAAFPIRAGSPLALAGVFSILGATVVAQASLGSTLGFFFVVIAAVLLLGTAKASYSLASMNACPVIASESGWQAVIRRTAFRNSSSVGPVVLPIAILASLSILSPSFAGRYDMDSDSSMSPTVLAGDTVIALKTPFSGTLRPGDVVVVHRFEGGFGVSRIAGLAADNVRVEHGHLIRNSQPVSEPYATKPMTSDALSFPIAPELISNNLLREQFLMTYGYTLVGRDSYLVPDGRVFLLNDDRNQAWDSRTIGPVDRYQVVARVVAVCPKGDCSSYYTPAQWVAPTLTWRRSYHDQIVPKSQI